MFMRRRSLFALLAVPFAGLAAGLALAGSIFKTGITEEDFEKKMDLGAVVKPIGKTRFDALPAGTRVGVFYKRFSILHIAHNPSEPNAHHYIMGLPGDPDWAYIKIATVEMYRTIGGDPFVIAVMREEAAAIGGEALTDCQREPLLLEDSQSRNKEDWRTTDFELVGYKSSC